MKPYKPKKPETKRQRELRELMHSLGWMTEKTHGSLYQKGWPDLFCSHKTYGVRWIEVKTGKGRLKESQVATFTKWTSFGVQIWVLTGPDDYPLLFKPPNWWRWLDPTKFGVHS